MSSRQRASEQITEAVTAWPQRGARSERRVRFTLRQREIGHLHGDSVAHFAFPKKVWVDLKEQGRIEDPASFGGGPVSLPAGSRPRATSTT